MPSGPVDDDPRPVVGLDTRSARPHPLRPAPQPQMPAKDRAWLRVAVIVAATSTVVVAAAVWSLRFRQEPTAAQAGGPRLGHVHDLVRDPASGLLLAGAHTGLFAMGVGAARPIGQSRDVMGLAAGRGALFASGHPAERRASPHVGLLRSDDGGRTWAAVGLDGEADLHAIALAGDEILGSDTVSGTVQASVDGRTWTSRAKVPLDRLVVTTDGDLIGASSGTLTRSRDRGVTWQAFDGPEAVALAVDGATLLALAADGLWTSRDQGRSFDRTRNGPAGKPTALHTDSTGIYAATVDRGRAGVWRLAEADWQPLYEDPAPDSSAGP